MFRKWSNGSKNLKMLHFAFVAHVFRVFDGVNCTLNTVESIYIYIYIENVLFEEMCGSETAIVMS